MKLRTILIFCFLLLELVGCSTTHQRDATEQREIDELLAEADRRYKAAEKINAMHSATHASDVERGSICWVGRVIDTGDATRIFMQPKYEYAARSITRIDGQHVAVKPDTDRSFILQEGETVWLSTLPHDNCTGRSVRRNGQFGVELESTACMPGMGCDSVKEYVAGERP